MEEKQKVNKGAERPLVGIVCNIKNDENDESQGEFDEPGTVSALERAINAAGYQTCVIDAGRELPQRLRDSGAGFAFNIAEGSGGRSREAFAPAMLEYAGIPFPGADAATLSIARYKDLTKRLLTTNGIVSPRSRLIARREAALPPEIDYPVIVKPNAEGSSKGIHMNCVAGSAAELEKILAGLEEKVFPVLVEEYIEGREFTVGLLGNGEGLRVFAPMEIIFGDLPDGRHVYGYEVKKNYRSYIRYECPPGLSPELTAQLMSEAETVFNALGCRDLARIDFRLSADEKLYFIEANPLPGLAPDYSDYPMLAAFCGVGYDELVGGILYAALMRYNMEENDEC